MGFLYPLALGALPILLGGLIYAYLKRGRGNKVIVSSVFILRTLQGAPSKPQTFRPPWRFFLEILLISLLVVGGSGLYRKGAGERYSVIIDNSPSMSAPLPGEASAVSILTIAKRDAASFLGSLSSDAVAMIQVVSPRLKDQSDELLSPDRASNLLDSIQIAYASDNLDQAITRALTDSRFTKVVVFTDKRANLGEHSTGGRLQVNSLVGSAKTPENIGITALSSSREKNSSDQTVKVTIGAYTERSGRARIVLASAGKNSTEIASRKLQFSGHGTQTVQFDGITLPDTGAVVRLQVEQDQTSALLPIDGVLTDDTAFISGGAPWNKKALLVGSSSAHELGLDQIPGFSFDEVKTSLDAERDGKLTGGGYPFIVFEHEVPETLPGINSLFVAPPTDNILIPTDFKESGGVVTRWRDDNPLTRYLALADLSFGKLSVLKGPIWMDEVVNSSVGPIVRAGEHKGSKFVALGFEIFPFEGKKNPTLSVLTLNILSYLGDLSSATGSLIPYSPIELLPGERRVTDEDGNSLSVETDGHGASRVTPQKPSILTFSGDGRSRSVAVNLFDESESDVHVVHEIAVSTDGIETSRPPTSNQSLLLYQLSWLVLGLILLELLVSLIGDKLKSRTRSANVGIA